MPVILLTARAEEVDRVVGLELGADDYVVKPFSPRELAVRVRNVLRRAAPPRRVRAATPPCDFGAAAHRPAAREVAVDGRAVPLTPKEFDLLAVLARSPRQVFSRRQLLEQVWDSAPEYQDPATVTVHVGRLRQKLERRPRPAPLDRHGVGRRLPVRAVSLPVAAGSWPTRSPTGPSCAAGRRGVAVACAGSSRRRLAPCSPARDRRRTARCATWCSPSRSSSLAIGAAAAVVLGPADGPRRRSGPGRRSACSPPPRCSPPCSALVASAPLGRDARRLEAHGAAHRGGRPRRRAPA